MGQGESEVIPVVGEAGVNDVPYSVAFRGRDGVLVPVDDDVVFGGPGRDEDQRVHAGEVERSGIVKVQPTELPVAGGVAGSPGSRRTGFREVFEDGCGEVAGGPGNENHACALFAGTFR